MARNRVYLEPDLVPSFLRNIGGYHGRKFNAVVCESVTITGTNWSGGSRSRYTGVGVNGRIGRSFGGSDMPAPWNNPVEGTEFAIPPGLIVVEHSIFRGKDLGLTFYVHPSNAAAMLPETGDSLTDDQKIVLAATAGLKSFARFDEAKNETHITRERYDAAVLSLMPGGYLRKNKAITPKGRNAIGDTRLEDLHQPCPKCGDTGRWHRC